MREIKEGSLISAISPPRPGESSDTSSVSAIALDSGPNPPVYTISGDLYKLDSSQVANGIGETFPEFIEQITDRVREEVRQSLGDDLIRDVLKEIGEETIERILDFAYDMMEAGVTYTLDQLIPRAVKEYATTAATSITEYLTNPDVQQAFINGIQAGFEIVQNTM